MQGMDENWYNCRKVVAIFEEAKRGKGVQARLGWIRMKYRVKCKNALKNSQMMYKFVSQKFEN